MVGGHSGLLEVGCAVLLRVQDLTWQDSFGGVRGLDVDWGAGGAPRVCVSEVMLRRAWAARAGEGVRPPQRLVGKDLNPAWLKTIRRSRLGFVRDWVSAGVWDGGVGSASSWVPAPRAEC